MELRLEGAERSIGAACPGGDAVGKRGSRKGRMGEHRSLVSLQSHEVAEMCVWIWSQTCTPILCRRVGVVKDKHEWIWDCEGEFHSYQSG